MPKSKRTTSPNPEDADLPEILHGLSDAIEGLREIGANFWNRGWSLGTSSNYSVVINRDPVELLVTASGMNKGKLKRTDFVRVNGKGRPVKRNQPKSSAETHLHVVAAELPGVGAVLHTHSVWGTLLSDYYFKQGGFDISGYEMLKGLGDIDTHKTSVRIEIFDNTQNIPTLARKVRKRLHDTENPLKYAYLIRGHGLYTWGPTLDAANRQIEVLEFLFECTGRRLMLEGAIPAVAAE